MASAENVSAGTAAGHVESFPAATSHWSAMQLPLAPMLPPLVNTATAPPAPAGPVAPVAPVTPVAPWGPVGPSVPVPPTSPARSKVKVIASAFANGLAAELSTFATVMFLYPVGEATAETLNTSHFVGSVVFTSRMCPFTAFVESASDASTDDQAVPPLSVLLARITVAVFCVALSRRRLPLAGSESVVVVENV